MLYPSNAVKVLGKLFIALIFGLIVGREVWHVLVQLADGADGVAGAGTTGIPGIEVVGDKVEKDQENRLFHLSEACISHQVHQPRFLSKPENTVLRNHMFIDFRHKFIYCSVPKVACTQWKQIILKSTEIPKYQNKDIKEIFPHYDNEFKRMSDQANKVQEETLLNTFYVFMFARDPMVRLVSAWKDKFQHHSKDNRFDYVNFHHVFGREIIKKFRKNYTKSELEQGFPVSFDEFVNYVISFENPLNMNEHWIPISLLCRPCNVQYNFVGKFEAQKYESEYLINKLKISEYVDRDFFRETKNSSVLETFEALSNLDESQKTKLYNLYKEDALLFGYDLRKFLKI